MRNISTFALKCAYQELYKELEALFINNMLCLRCYGNALTQCIHISVHTKNIIKVHYQPQNINKHHIVNIIHLATNHVLSFSEKVRLHISCELSATENSHEMSSLNHNAVAAFVIGAERLMKHKLALPFTS